MHKLHPTSHVQDRCVHVTNAKGIVSLDRLAGDWKIGIRVIRPKARFAIKQVESERVDPRGKGQLEIHFGLESHDHGIGFGLFHSCVDNPDI